MTTLERNLKGLALGLAAAILWHGTVQAQTTLDPAWRVTGVDTNKPGFIWNYFSNNANTANTADRAELYLSGLATDSTGAPLPNLGDPATVGPAIGPAAPANPASAVLHFEIPGVINLSKTDGDTKGNFTPDELQPGLNSNESTDGQAAEILTYLTLPKGPITMGVNSDDGFQTASGSNPQSAFGKVVLGEFNSGRGASDTLFTFVVQEAGTYPFRTIWENGGGDSNVEWFTVQPDGQTKVLLNDTANGGIPAFRALAASAVVAPYVKTAFPAPVPRQVEGTSRSVSLALVDGTSPVDDNSVTLQVDGKATTVTKQRKGNTVTVDTGALDGLHLPGEAHTGALTFKDSTGKSYSEQWTFYNLENLILPASPVTGENFDSYPEATSDATAVPPGWVATNYTYKETEGWDLTDIKSDAFLGWVMINTNTVFGVEDEVLDNDKTQLINGQPVANWMSGNLIFAASDGRARTTTDGFLASQAQIVVSKAFNLSTVNNPVMTFSSGARISTGNWEQLTTEYSIDKGTNWFPAIYMRNSSSITLKPDGSFDAVAMFTTVNTNQIPYFPNPDPSVGPLGGKFGDMLAAPISQDLAPYIAIRNDGIAARRVEAIRLPKASKQADVRLRFTHLSACGWEWGIDNIAFYDIAGTTSSGPNITSVAIAGGSITIQWTNGGTLESSPTLGGAPVWTSTGNSSGSYSEPVAASGNKFYRVKQ